MTLYNLVMKGMRHIMKWEEVRKLCPDTYGRINGLLGLGFVINSRDCYRFKKTSNVFSVRLSYKRWYMIKRVFPLFYLF